MQKSTINDAVDFCLEHKVSIEQFLFLYFLKSSQSSNDVMKRYLKQCGQFDVDDTIVPLEDKGFLENMNSPGKYYPEMFMLTPKCEEIFASSYAFDELWDAYPPTFPLKDGSLFISRAGMDKEDLAVLYMSRINFSAKTHAYVMSKLDSYKRLVNDGKLNGHKIVQFVREALWESIPDSKQATWGKDV